jgi:2-polyprenyl-3-methyl-5-hydroxy-6-metoxy-1,4-benzoquinol methylase
MWMRDIGRHERSRESWIEVMRSGAPSRVSAAGNDMIGSRAILHDARETRRLRQGMVEWNEEYFDLTPELDLFQYRMIKPHLGNDILEIGAGPGRITRLLLGDGGSYSRFVVSEPSDHFFEQLKMRIPPTAHCTLVQETASDLLRRYPLAFDTIFSVDVLEHVEDDRQFVTDCLGMLKPGGKLIALVPALQILYSDFDRSIGHYRRYNKTMVRDLVRGLDYQIQQLYYTNFLAIIPSLIFFKMRKLDYQNTSNKKQFIFLERLYSKYFIPVINLMERYIPMPLGLNLTFVLKKNEVGQAMNCPHT